MVTFNLVKFMAVESFSWIKRLKLINNWSSLNTGNPDCEGVCIFQLPIEVYFYIG